MVKYYICLNSPNLLSYQKIVIDGYVLYLFKFS